MYLTCITIDDIKLRITGIFKNLALIPICSGYGVQQRTETVRPRHQLGKIDHGSNPEPHVTGCNQPDDDVLLHSLRMECALNSKLADVGISMH